MGGQRDEMSDGPAPLHPVAWSKLNKHANGVSNSANDDPHAYVAPRIARQPDMADEERTSSRLDRSDRIAFISLGLVFAVLIARVRFPDLTKSMAVELRYLLAIFAGCFLLGISGWFRGGSPATAKVDAMWTMLALAVLVGFWEALLSGGFSSAVGKAIVSLQTIRLR